MEQQNLFLALLFLNLITTGFLITRKYEGRGRHTMGRTLPTSTMLIQDFEESWQPYARALRKEDREMLSELFAMVRFQSAAIAYASRPGPFQVFALAMLGGMMKRVMHLETIAERESASFSEEYGESFPVDGHPSGRDWKDVSDWEQDPGSPAA
jgi:hypothetical protein